MKVISGLLAGIGFIVGISMFLMTDWKMGFLILLVSWLLAMEARE